MSIQIEISTAHIKQLTEFYIERLKVLKKEISEREKEIKEISKTLQPLKKGDTSENMSANQTSKAAEYSEQWPWVKKVAFAIEFEGRPMTTREIVDTLSEFEASFLADRKRVVASISSVLSSKSGDKKEFLRITTQSGDNAYDINKSKFTEKEDETAKPENSSSGFTGFDQDDDEIPF